MPFIDHEHRHQWEQIGTTQGKTGMNVEVVYQCTECDAWTSLTLRNSAYVEFSEGELATDPQEDSDAE